MPSLSLGFPICKIRGLAKTSLQQVLTDILVCFLLLIFQQVQVQAPRERGLEVPTTMAPQCQKGAPGDQFVIELTGPR